MPPGNPDAVVWSGEVPPEIDFNTTETEVVIDLKALCVLPFDHEMDGVHAFRALFMPRGKTMKVPDAHGCYIVDGTYSNQTALSVVHFVDSTKRLPELLLSFIDHGMASGTQTGISVSSLKLPLLIRANTYEREIKVAPITDVAGFSRIKISDLPWSAHLEPALKLIEPFRTLAIGKPSAMDAWIKRPLADRLDSIRVIAVSDLDDEVAAVTRQDASQGSRIRTAGLARIDSAIQAIRARAAAYDVRLVQRVVQLKDAKAGPEDASLSPVRAAFAAIEPVRLLRSRVTSNAAGATAAAAAPADVQDRAEAGAEDEARLVDDSDDSSDDSSVDSSADRGAAETVPPKKRARIAPTFFGARIAPPKPKKPKPPKGKGTSAAGGKAREPKSSAPAAGANGAAVNPRTQAPWKRGPYRPRNSPADALKSGKGKADTAATGQDAAATEVERLKASNAALTSSNTILTAENAKLKAEVGNLRENFELRIQNEVMKSQVKACGKMMEQFKAGVGIAIGQASGSSAAASGHDSDRPLMTPLPAVPRFNLS